MKDVTLRPWPSLKKEKLTQEDLFLQIQQLTTERGHLRDITEKSLQEDIVAGKDVPEDSKEGMEPGEREKDVPTKKEMLDKVFNAQREMYSHLEYA